MDSRATLFSFFSGFFAATTSLLGKISFGVTLIHICDYYYLQRFSGNSCNIVILVIRGLFITLLVLSNILMWTIFSKALALSKSTVEVIVTNTASNFIASALFGEIFFNESFALTWFVGMGLILLGLYIVHSEKYNDLSKIE